MRSLDDLATLLETHDGCEEELSVVEAVTRELDREVPTYLVSTTGDWNTPYLPLRFEHRDRSVLTVTQGDGYTEVVAPGVEYSGYIDAAALIDVVKGALDGRTSYVRHTRLG